MEKAFLAVQSGFSGAGVIAWWEMRGRVDPDALSDAFAESGLDIKVPRTSPARALSQAVAKYAGRRASRDHGAFAVAGPRGSWFLVERTLLDEGVDLALATFAKVEVSDEECVVTPLNGSESDPAKEVKLGIAYQIAGAADIFAMTTGRAQISGWLSRVHLDRFAGVSLRSSGGFYFVPAAMRDQWAAFWRVLAAQTANEVSSIDALPTEETIAAVSAALRRESDNALDALSKVMAEAAETGLGDKSRNAQLREIKRLRAKLAKYSGLLGASLADIIQAADDIEVTLAVIPEA